MPSASALYEPLIARDLDAIGPAAREFRAGSSSEELFLAVGRFAVLAFAPSQHAKHAVLAVLAAHELRDDYGDRWDDLIVECARYAAASRQPWSEPPILDPPAIDEDQRTDLEELREAIRTADRLRAERWLAGRLDDPSLEDDLLSVAAEDLSDFGHKLIVVNAAWKLTSILGEKGRYGTLRMAVWELTSYDGGSRAPAGSADPATLLDQVIGRCVEERGSLESAHAVFLFDAAFERGILDRVAGHLLTYTAAGRVPAPAARREPPVYRLGRDLGAALKAHAVARRLRRSFPEAPLDAFVEAVHQNLEEGPSLEEWSFA